jgi:hypothetical protein
LRYVELGQYNVIIYCRTLITKLLSQLPSVYALEDGTYVEIDSDPNNESNELEPDFDDTLASEIIKWIRYIGSFGIH